MSNGLRDLLVRGIAAAKAGERDEARHYLEWALRQEPSADEQLEAWLWLSEVARDRDEARRWLEEVLANDTHNPRALRRLALLDGRLQSSELIDPDRFGSVVSGDTEIDVERFSCPSCGGRMAYAPDGDGLQCDRCGQRMDVGMETAHNRVAPEDFILALATPARKRARRSPAPRAGRGSCLRPRRSPLPAPTVTPRMSWRTARKACWSRRRRSFR